MIRGRAVVAGAAAGPVLASREPLSFWGGYDHQTGEIIDRRHPLSGRIAAGTVLVLPGSRGSSTTSAVLLEAIRSGTAPAAIMTVGVDRFLTLTSIVAFEMFGVTLPIVAVSEPEMTELQQAERVTIGADGTIEVEGS